VLDCLKSGLLMMSISGRQFLMNRHSPKRMDVRLVFVYFSPFCFLASTQNRFRMSFNSGGVTVSNLQHLFLAFKYCSNTATADFVALFVFLLSLLATSVSMSSSVTLANRVPLSAPPRCVAIACRLRVELRYSFCCQLKVATQLILLSACTNHVQLAPLNIEIYSTGISTTLTNGIVVRVYRI